MRLFSSQQLMVILAAVPVLLGIFAVRHVAFSQDENIGSVKRPEYVYEIRGEVESPGFYSYENKQTIEQLINACGTLRDGIKSIKLKQELQTGTRLVFNGAIKIDSIDAAARINFFLPICVNDASQEDIELIPGVGKKTAESIVCYRDKKRGIKDLKELINIRGIGKKKLTKILPYLSL